MRLLNYLVAISLTWNAICATNTTKEHVPDTLNKTKRGVAFEQTHYFAEPVPTRYQEHVNSAGSNPGITYYPVTGKPLVFQNGNPLPKLAYDQEPPKVTAQQVLYEYQQTPHNTVSNVHVNQHYQTVPEYHQDAAQSPTAYPTQGPAPVPLNQQFVHQSHVLQVEPNQQRGVVSPVQHSSLIHHNSAYPKFLYGPFPLQPVTHVQTGHPNKYLYINGKIVLHPTAIPTPTAYPGIAFPARPHTLSNHQPFAQRPTPLPKNFRPSPPLSSTGIQTFHSFSKTTPAPVKEEPEEDDSYEEKSNVRDSDDDEERSSYEQENEEEEDEGFKPSLYTGKFKYEDDDDEDHAGYREEGDAEEDEDNTRSYSRYVRKKPKKHAKKSAKPKKHKSGYNYKSGYESGYESNHKNAKHSKSPKSYSKGINEDKHHPKGHYKSYKFYKSSNGKPKVEVIEGHQSQNVPVVHKQKMYKEKKWFISKDSESE